MEKTEKKQVPQDIPTSIHDKEWYIIFMKSGIPILEFFYLLFMAIKNKDQTKKSYAKAMIMYRMTILATGILMLLVGIWISIPYIRKLLDDMELL